MRIELACFSKRGHALGLSIQDALSEQGDVVGLSRCSDGLRVGDWAAERFAVVDALVFIGAAGIAVRAVAPHVTAKTSDPAVVCVDDTGRYAISLLSGHLGGANALTRRIAAIVRADPVITTATDRSGVFAIDVWAASNGFAIVNPQAIKTVSALLLGGQPVRMAGDFTVEGGVPEWLIVSDWEQADCVLGAMKPANDRALWLVPPVATLGVGCRKGVTADELETFFLRFCAESKLSPLAVRRVCSIDLKKDEAGLVEFCARRGLPFATFSPEVLNGAPGDFHASERVKKVTGVDNVCERAAVAGSGGRLVVRKTTGSGIAMAAAVRPLAVSFDLPEGERS